ncbi:CU044_2847 family protein [Phytohabitans sp. ZYX-F-186]|uniref:CU044_2847 family protein n=1 Tax=Phytohabitans maris TaxID=3071409 RepID=A0ABU0ZS93_9ACTN|nr:CU044_2847 family protein [Phytohabitans sp. ZYX-F-186]MDQ7909900.1 CU044_2847 family protein [Phytohabitans sp. ZYX-F-186]
MEFVLSDGSTVLFESEGVLDGGLVTEHSGVSDGSRNGGRLRERFERIAATAQEISTTLRQNLAPDEVEVELAVKVNGEAGAFMFAKSTAEAAVTIRLRWTGSGA